MVGACKGKGGIKKPEHGIGVSSILELQYVEVVSQVSPELKLWTPLACLFFWPVVSSCSNVALAQMILMFFCLD